MPMSVPLSETADASPLLRVEDLCVSYGTVEAVRGIDFQVHAGEQVVLLGANGAGKSSTLNGLVGLAPVIAGRALLDGSPLQGLPTERLPRQGLTLCPEGRRIFAALSVEEHLRLGGYVLPRREVASEIARMYTLFPILAERRRQLAGTLSGGQQQMLAIARALMCRPRLLLLDEPSLGLAPRIVEQVFALIAGLRGQGVTVLLVEQNVAMSLEIADRGYVMAAGRIVAADSAAALRDSNLVAHTYLAH
jgi:branched-chain amino acid transport system ATP-binding protein